MRKNLFPFLALALSLSACASFQRGQKVSSGVRPSWIDGSSIEYPSGLYLTGVGSSDSQASAGNAARAELAKIISSRVTVHESVSEAEGTRQVDGHSKKTFSQSVSQAVQVASQRVLRGVRIVSYWENPVTKNYYALAVMDRQKASLALTDKISTLDQEMRQWGDLLESSAHKFGRARAAMKVSALIKARKHLTSQLQVISPVGQTPPSPIDEAKAQVQIEKALSVLSVAVNVSGESANLIEAGIIQGLNGLGISASAGTSVSKPDILINGQVKGEALNQLPLPWKWGRATAMVSLENARAGNVFSQFNVEDREASSSSHSDAIHRADEALGDKISKKIRAAITAYFENI